MFHRKLTKEAWIVCAAAGLILLAARSALAQNGACCLPAGTCASVTAGVGECNGLSGFYLGDGSTCAGSDCSRGPCIQNDLGGNTCATVSKPQCDLEEGYWVPPPATCASLVMNTDQAYTPPNGGQINVSGATLFADFFEFPASVNDFYNMDGDSIYCRNPLPNGQVSAAGPFVGFADTDCNPGVEDVDRLAPGWTCGGYWGHWTVNYRSVGSIEGFSEFVEWQLTGTLPQSIPSERGLLNGVRYATTGAVGGPAAACARDCFPPGGAAGDTGTPVCQDSVDFANTDVPSSYGVVGQNPNQNRWDRKPTQDGYGLNQDSSHTNGGLNTVPQLASLERPGFGSLNLNVGSPDANTIFDTPIAWSPVACIGNRGTGRQNVRFSELQHLFVTGRMPNGENLVGVTRDTGSGTRNAWSNSLAIDPSQANGDNVGPRIEGNAQSQLGLVPPGSGVPLPVGSRTQPTNCGGSTISELAVQNWRLAIGYTGLVGSSRTEGDTNNGLYEALNVCRDVDADGVAIPGFACAPQNCDNGPNPAAVAPRHPSCPTPPANSSTPNNGYVRPNLFNVLDNANPLCGWTIGGVQTLNTRGDPLSGPGIPPYEAGNSNPPMGNLAARDYIRNLRASIAAFTASPGTPDSNLMPGQLFATRFFLTAAVDNAPTALNPTDFTNPSPGFLQSLQDFVRCNNLFVLRDFGSVNVGGKVPTRNNLTNIPPVGTLRYSDGGQTGQYDSNGLGSFTLAAGTNLNQRNQTSGDFKFDGVRNITDIPEMLKALANPRQYERDEVLSPPPFLPGSPSSPNRLGGMSGNYVVPEIIGDFNGDGSFTGQDIRYFADGLAIDPATGRLNRCFGWELVDQWWLYYKVGPGSSFLPGTLRPEYAGSQPPWHPTLPGYMPAWPNPRVLGAAMADIAGSVPSKGYEPTGHDGIVNGLDIDYVYDNFGDFTNLRYDAERMDLSADMNGDLAVNQLDVDKIVRDVLCTHFGDANLDGVVDGADQTIVNTNLGMPGGWAQGDFDGDGTVTVTDQTTVNSNLGQTSSCRRHCVSDMNCDGQRNGLDIQQFCRAVLDPVGYDNNVANCGCIRHNADANADGVVNAMDADGFANDLLATQSCPN